MQSLLEQIPGYVRFCYTVLPGFAVGFTFFDSAEHHDAASRLFDNYLHNANGVANIFGDDLISSGAVVVLASCTSWQPEQSQPHQL